MQYIGFGAVKTAPDLFILGKGGLAVKSKAVHYYKEGYNCSQCIVKAAEKHYRIKGTEQMNKSLSGICMGFGVGCMCSILVGGIIVFGLLFDEETVKRMRIKLLDEFTKEYGSINCCVLKNRQGKGSDCEDLVFAVAELVEEIIEEERALS